jgi:hypothetical protein
MPAPSPAATAPIPVGAISAAVPTTAPPLPAAPLSQVAISPVPPVSTVSAAPAPPPVAAPSVAVPATAPPLTTQQMPASPPSAEAPAPAVAQPTPESVAPPAAAVPPPTPAFTAFAERLATPGSRDEIGQILMEFARPRAAAALLLMVRRDEAAGWLGFGPGLDDESIETCRVDLSVPSFVRALRDGERLHRGALSPIPAHAEIRAMLSTNWATDLLALPLRMRERLVGVLVLTLEEGEFAPATVEELTRLAERASEALEVIVLRQKRQTP